MINKFLNKLKKEEKLKLVKPSEEIKDSYLEKSSNCLKSAKLLLKNKLYENSIGMSYYAMYNVLLALLFKTGIKCENHSGSILLLNLLYEEEAYKIISDAKKERIDKQYYVTTEKNEITKEIAEELLYNAEEFVLHIKTVIINLDNNKIEFLRKMLSSITL